MGLRSGFTVDGAELEAANVCRSIRRDIDNLHRQSGLHDLVNMSDEGLVALHDMIAKALAAIGGHTTDSLEISNSTQESAEKPPDNQNTKAYSAFCDTIQARLEEGVFPIIRQNNGEQARALISDILALLEVARREGVLALVR